MCEELNKAVERVHIRQNLDYDILLESLNSVHLKQDNGAITSPKCALKSYLIFKGWK